MHSLGWRPVGTHGGQLRVPRVRQPRVLLQRLQQRAPPPRGRRHGHRRQVTGRPPPGGRAARGSRRVHPSGGGPTPPRPLRPPRLGWATSSFCDEVECFRRVKTGGEGRARGAEIWVNPRSPGWNASRVTPDAVHSSPPPPRRAALAPAVHPPDNTPVKLTFIHTGMWMKAVQGGGGGEGRSELFPTTILHSYIYTRLPKSSVYPSSAAASSRMWGPHGQPFSRAQRSTSSWPCLTA